MKDSVIKVKRNNILFEYSIILMKTQPKHCLTFHKPIDGNESQKSPTDNNKQY